MTLRLHVIPALTVTLFLLIAPARALAQQAQVTTERDPTPVSRWHLSDVAPQADTSARGGGAAWKGALIGAVAGLGLSAYAANRYGNNEGGEFCVRCMVQWSAVTLPLGAAVGAGIGYGIDRSRRSITATPMISRRAKGLFVSARF